MRGVRCRIGEVLVGRAVPAPMIPVATLFCVCRRSVETHNRERHHSGFSLIRRRNANDLLTNVSKIPGTRISPPRIIYLLSENHILVSEKGG